MATYTYCYYSLCVGILLYCGGGGGVAARPPTQPSWLWEPVAPSLGTCGHFRGNITRSGYVSSPKYPSNYPDSLSCDIIVYVPENHMVRLYFVDFVLESSRECWLDHLEITQQDHYEVSQRLGIFCGRQMPPLVIGFAPSIRLTFMSDRYVSARGFRARLEYIPLI